MLVNNPRELKCLVAELDTEFPSKYDPITFAKTQDLPYLNTVIDESLRVLPIINAGHLPYVVCPLLVLTALAGIPRITTETTVLADYTIPPGVSDHH